MPVLKSRPERSLTSAVIIALLALLPLATPVRADDPTPQQRLAAEVMRSALSAAAINPLTSDALNMACLLAQEAVALDPDSPGLWRLTLDIASLAERDSLREQALEAIGRLDPSDESVRLQRLNLALDRYPTVEQREAAYERLLEDENIPRVGEAVASRLAFDFALLKQRTGDTDAFTRWLTRSLELDRSNRTAAALAAGFFQANVNDPVGRAELLTNLIMADPTDIQTQLTLAQLLLDNGAYVAAARIYQLASDGMTASHKLATSDLMADIAVSQWAAGDLDASLATIDRRQAEIDENFRAEKARTDRTLTMVQIGDLKGPVDPTLAAVAAVIHHSRADAQVKSSLQAAIAAFEADIAFAKAAKPPAEPADLASRSLQAAWIALWLGDDATKAAELVAAADALEPLSDQAKTRFDGWKALRSGDIAGAIERFQSLPADDSAARVGLAIAFEREGQSREAARELLQINASQPGTMIGIWSASQLARILGQRVPLSKQATDLERLIASIPRAFDRYPRDASMAISLKFLPRNVNPHAFDPLVATIELTNNSPMPLSIDRDGPLRPGVLVDPKISSSVALANPPRAFIVELDSRLRLLPRETVSSEIDLRWYNVADVMNQVAASGGLVNLTLDSNFVVTGTGQLIPGLFGVRHEAPLLRIDGIRREPNWIENGLAMLNNPAPPAAPAEADALMLNIALLANELTLTAKDADLAPERTALLQQVRNALPAAFGRLDPTRQAWLMCVMNRPTPVVPLLDIARKSDSRLVKLTILLYQLTGEQDPMLDAARRSDDPVLREFAECLVRQTEATYKAIEAATGKPSTSRASAPTPPATRPVAPSPPSTGSSKPATAPSSPPASAPATAPGQS